MNIDFISDMHMELNDRVEVDIEIPDGTLDDILILNGDITCYRHFQPHRTDKAARAMRDRFLNLMKRCKRYKHIYWIPGNHEYYRFHLEGADDWFQKIVTMLDERVVILNNKMVGNDKFVLVGSTFWVNFARDDDPMQNWIKSAVEDGMNDFHVIMEKEGSRVPITADLIQGVHQKSFEWIKHCYEEHKDDRPFIVATHHAPSEKSHSFQRFGDSALKWGYLTEYGDWIADTRITNWIHGHTHHNVDYHINSCHVQSAMYGYIGYDRTIGDKHMTLGRIEL